MYALIEIVPGQEFLVADQPQYNLTVRVVRQGHTDVKVANVARTGYLALYPEVNPQNVQLLSYAL